jgi:hypothetical protein
MEEAKDQRFINWKNLTRFLSKILVEKNIRLDNNGARFAQLFEYFVTNYGLKDLVDLLTIYHRIKGHQESRIKLKCGSAHCIECYYHVTCEIIKDSQNMECTCGMRVPPNFRFKIEQEYKRIQSLKIDCRICGERKDRMNFAVIVNHKCPACSSCIIKTYSYRKGVKNCCPLCRQTYDEEGEVLARNAYETVIPPEQQLEYYKETCVNCKRERDSRTFQVICEDAHEYCQDCIKQLRDCKASNCPCGLALSLFNS